jgi:FkbM family methyltransferase
MMKSHSQHGEDVRIYELLKLPHSKYIVDVGANDGFSWSNSFAFVNLGFSALLIEPMKKYAQFCREQHRGNPNVAVEETAILNRLGTVKFYINNDVERDLLSMTSSVRRDIIDSQKVSEVEVPVCPLSVLLARHSVPRDYAILNVDAEGVDLEVLQTADLGNYRPAVICVEYGINENPVHEFLINMMYEKRDHLGPNGIYTPAKQYARST